MTVLTCWVQFQEPKSILSSSYESSRRDGITIVNLSLEELRIVLLTSVIWLMKMSCFCKLHNDVYWLRRNIMVSNIGLWLQFRKNVLFITVAIALALSNPVCWSDRIVLATRISGYFPTFILILTRI
jgi:hypothetical protein